jgi:DNA-binding MarR family transcriptional regulator
MQAVGGAASDVGSDVAASGQVPATQVGPERRGSDGDAQVGALEALEALEALTRIVVRMAWRSAHPAPSGMTFSQFRCLLALHELGVLSCSKLADAVEMNVSSISRQADRLHRQGYLVRGHPAGNRVVVTLELTQAGREVVDQVLGRRHAALRSALERMTPGGCRQVAAAARQFAASTVATGAARVNEPWPL